MSWIHIEQSSAKDAACSFRSVREAVNCYNRFNRIIGVSKEVRRTFLKELPVKVPMQVLYNTNESAAIVQQSKEAVDDGLFQDGEIKLVGVGKLLKHKGFDRMARIVKRLDSERYPVHLYALGVGPLRDELERYRVENHLEGKITLLGYQTNPYKYVAKCDLFVCASYAEGFSTAATEALIVGTPVCTVEVSGMKEMLGEKEEKDSGEAVSREFLESGQGDYAFVNRKNAACGWIFYLYKLQSAVDSSVSGILVSEIPLIAVLCSHNSGVGTFVFPDFLPERSRSLPIT